MSRTIAAPDHLYQKAAELAARDHMSVEEFVSSILANRLASREFIEARAMRFNRADFERALSQIPDTEPEAFDR